jgi:hypothetical protein
MPARDMKIPRTASNNTVVLMTAASMPPKRQ